MPNIPNVPGVPALSSYSPNGAILLAADAVSIIDALIGPQWGIFVSGSAPNLISNPFGNQIFGLSLNGQAFPYNSIVDVDFKQDWPISDYQVEDGGFQSYDKVQLPFDVKVRVASGGNPFARQALLTSVLAAANTLNLYDIVTPEQTYTGCCITHVDFKRAAHNGVGVILMDIWFLQVRITSTSTYSNTQSPTVASVQNTGNVSPVAFANAPFSAGSLR